MPFHGLSEIDQQYTYAVATRVGISKHYPGGASLPELLYIIHVSISPSGYLPAVRMWDVKNL
jgi:hypothetical protein